MFVNELFGNMSIISFGFLVFLAISVCFYYIVAMKYQWIVLLIFSILFYICAANPYTIFYIVASTLVAYWATYIFGKLNDESTKAKRKVTLALSFSIIFNLLIWFILKGYGFWNPVFGILTYRYDVHFLAGISGKTIISSLGVGYYTLQIIGYIIDCYWGNIESQRNIAKLFLFIIYFPQLIVGPISKYSDLSSLYEAHDFSYQNISFGAQRILWGFLKKLVLADRIGIFVNTISNNQDIYHGFFSWILILIYPLQMYTDFSGCMDIVIGVSEMFGITLTENFNNPFFSRTSQEFWQRWHITLGLWAKTYVLYPLLKTKFMLNLGKCNRRLFGKKAGKFITTSVGMFVLWFVIGAWHGGYRYIVGVNFWFWIVLTFEELLSTPMKKLSRAMQIKTESFSWHLFQSIRTYLLYAIGVSFFGLGVTQGFRVIKDALGVIFTKGAANPWILFDGSIVELGIDYGDINIIIVGIVMLIIVANLREKHGFARIWISQQTIVFRFVLWLGLFVFVLINGEYGPFFTATNFIYQGF